MARRLATGKAVLTLKLTPTRNARKLGHTRTRTRTLVHIQTRHHHHLSPIPTIPTPHPHHYPQSRRGEGKELPPAFAGDGPAGGAAAARRRGRAPTAALITTPESKPLATARLSTASRASLYLLEHAYSFSSMPTASQAP